jgi:hypothetical protein
MPLTRPLYAFRWDKLQQEKENQYREFLVVKGTKNHENAMIMAEWKPLHFHKNFLLGQH